ncbi:MAG: SWIM zinc finger family protein [Candidatus Dormibacteraeota bacterium]|nr:SWIM zinc finger family protein [Candidatus Dormibacteraeota bacterium]
MPSRDNFVYFPRSQPRRVEGGIQARSRRGEIGESWWSRRFLEILESFEYGSRLTRGRAYARRGQVLDLSVGTGVVDARVQGSRVRPYRVQVAVKPLSDPDWARAEEAMASKAVFMATLLAGEMPKQVEEAFAECRLSLFPSSRRDLASACSCPDQANPCKHVAAVFYLLAEAFDADPFLVFKWRGRSKEELIERLRALRGAAPGPGTPSATLPETDSGPALEECLDRFWEVGEEMGRLEFRPVAPEAPDSLVRQLGPAPVTVAGEDLGRVLAAAYRAMSSGAERMALGEGDE